MGGKMKKIFLMMVAVTMMVSCGSFSLNKSAGVGKLSTSVSVDPPPGLVSDVTLGSKISGSANGTFLFGMMQLSGNKKYADNVFSGFGKVNQIKAAAAYEALAASGADIIVNPQYVVEKRVSPFNITTSYEVTVTGVAGMISVSKCPGNVCD